jgi:hypothetical protein
MPKMELILRAKLENVFKARDFVNKNGELESKGKWQLQFMEKVESVEDGFQIVVHKVSVPEEKVSEYKNKIGNVVTLPVKVACLKGKVYFYGV